MRFHALAASGSEAPGGHFASSAQAAAVVAVAVVSVVIRELECAAPVPISAVSLDIGGGNGCNPLGMTHPSQIVVTTVLRLGSHLVRRSGRTFVDSEVAH